MRSQRVLTLADRAESGNLSGFFGQFHYGRAYEVLAATNHGEAVSAMTRGRPDLIVIDPQMKGLDGLQLLKQLRVNDRTIPVIIVTGAQTTHDAVGVLKAGVFAYVPTPCDFPRFEHLVALALSDARNAGSA